ncbi:S-layer glycoprotein N-glycosyltransferase AglJ [Halomicrobium mukohataei]|uniref:S-layer glycoprotein N-glycosyltransferase AglJ n=1 Tax=Halomicrobium mukohataei TaxID=57705 RepID=A0A847TXW7_9EURY|nr:S-layer glycoprotein N-glycosyltransferase AglJ [Halomicrobium mukohataei]NLV10842.1 S-layer glycoprotein N-glycosyltransferase AglJ [Halomicrobium mukohataei]
MADRDDVCVLVPTYNEAATIGDVVASFVGQGFEHVLVIDGGSDDGTRELAAEAGARVVEQSGTGEGSGKGQAVREALDRYVEQPYVLMLDGDATYRPDEADRLLEPLFDGRAEHVIGNRFADMEPGAMTRLNQIGNGIINTAFSVIHGRDLTDILSGYRAFTLESVRQFDLTADGFGIETEMAVECVKQGVSTTVVPITYQTRPNDSETNLDPFSDGAVIILTLYRMAKTNNPLFYFGSVGVVSALSGVVLAIYVAYEWFVVGVSHEVIALVAASGLLFGIQLLMFGVLSDMIVALNREQTRRLSEIARQVGDESTAADAADDTEPSTKEESDGERASSTGRP